MKKILSLAISLILIFTFTSTVNARSEKQHINLDIFDGYSGYEITPMGHLGYNLAFEAPNGYTLKLGFNPEKSKANDSYLIANGWSFKLPYVNKSELYNENGYSYDISKKLFSNNVYIKNYPTKHNISVNKNGTFLDGPYNTKKVFNCNGDLIQSLDNFENTITYKYNKSILNNLSFSDDSSINIVKDENNRIIITYAKGTTFKVLATLFIDNVSHLTSVKFSDGEFVDFEYIDNEESILISSYSKSNCYSRIFQFENKIYNPRVTHICTIYSDGDVSCTDYKYDSIGCICEILRDDDLERYDYKINSDGKLIVSTVKNIDDEITENKKIYNEHGQIIEYCYPGNALSLKYDDNGNIQQETENGIIANYNYNSKGLPTTVKCSDNRVYNYHYSKDGILKNSTLTVNGITTIYDIGKNGLYDETNTTISPYAASVSVLYNINSQVCVTNWHTVYNYAQNSFNCYTYSIGKSGEISNPGYYSGKNIANYIIAGTYFTVSRIKLFTEDDQEALGRWTSDTTVNGTHNAHAWKIALRVSSDDYHFMKKSYSTSARPTYWEFKAGKSGPVMRLRGSYTPTTATWDMYKLNSSTNKYVVAQSKYYTSAIKYICIHD